MQNSNLISILITGANKGIGYGIVKSLLEKQSSLKEWKYKIILTSRDETRGLETISEFNKSFGDLKDYLIYRSLDITNETSVNSCVDWVKSEFGKIDILVNNAGVAFKGDEFNTSVFDTTFATNVFGTIDLTEKMLQNSLIKEKGKIIIVASSLGNVTNLGENIQKEFRNQNMEKDELIELANRFRSSIEKGTNKQEGWGQNCYAASKMFINKYTNIVANRDNVQKQGIQVYSCCPGWVRTDMGGPNAYRSLDEGVVCPIYLVELEHVINPDLQGKFFYDSKVSYIGI